MFVIYLLFILVNSVNSIKFHNTSETQKQLVTDVLDLICKGNLCTYNEDPDFYVVSYNDWEEVTGVKVRNAVGYYSYSNNIIFIQEEFLFPEIIIHEFYHYFTLQGFDQVYIEMFANATVDLHKYLDKRGISGKPRHWLSNGQEFGATMFELWFKSIDTLSLVNEDIDPDEFISTNAPTLFRLFSTYFQNRNICETKFSTDYDWCTTPTNKPLDVILIVLIYVEILFLLVLYSCSDLPRTFWLYIIGSYFILTYLYLMREYSIYLILYGVVSSINLLVSILIIRTICNEETLLKQPTRV